MLARREAIESAGFLDERFFIYSEETDFCLRIVRSGWEICHFPYLTIIHHAGKGGFNPRMASQEAYARRQYLSKHYGPIGRAVGIGALTLRYAFRAIGGGRDKEVNQARRAASRNAVATLFGLKEPPFGPPPKAGRLDRRRRTELIHARRWCGRLPRLPTACELKIPHHLPIR